MSKITRTKLFRNYEAKKTPWGYDLKKRVDPIPAMTNEKIKIKCSHGEIEIFVSPGQRINTEKACKRALLK